MRYFLLNIIFTLQLFKQFKNDMGIKKLPEVLFLEVSIFHIHYSSVKLLTGFEPVASALPRRRSTC